MNKTVPYLAYISLGLAVFFPCLMVFIMMGTGEWDVWYIYLGFAAVMDLFLLAPYLGILRRNQGYATRLSGGGPVELILNTKGMEYRAREAGSWSHWLTFRNEAGFVRYNKKVLLIYVSSGKAARKFYIVPRRVAPKEKEWKALCSFVEEQLKSVKGAGGHPPRAESRFLSQFQGSAQKHAEGGPPGREIRLEISPTEAEFMEAATLHYSPQLFSVRDTCPIKGRLRGIFTVLAILIIGANTKSPYIVCGILGSVFVYWMLLAVRRDREAKGAFYQGGRTGMGGHPTKLIFNDYGVWRQQGSLVEEWASWELLRLPGRGRLRYNEDMLLFYFWSDTYIPILRVMVPEGMKCQEFTGFLEEKLKGYDLVRCVNVSTKRNL